MNNVSIIGRLVNDPIKKQVGNDLTVCNFTLAFDKKKKDAGANFIDCCAWQQTANYIGDYAKKGQQIAIQGFLDQQTWEKDGKKSTKIQIVVSDAKLISGGRSTEEKASQQEELDLSSIPF